MFGSPAEETPNIDTENGKAYILQMPYQTVGLPTKGFLQGWTVYLDKNATVFLLIWRPLGNDKYKLIVSQPVEVNYDKI